MSDIKENTHIVIKRKDAVNYLNENQITKLYELLCEIDSGRLDEGKDLNKYYICNKDEPYADEVLKVILRGEDRKRGGMMKRIRLVFVDSQKKREVEEHPFAHVKPTRMPVQMAQPDLLDVLVGYATWDEYRRWKIAKAEGRTTE